MATTQEYANLSKQVYDNPNINKVYSELERKPASIGGRDYIIYEHASNPKTGYQGTVYQDVASKEFIVAHRGTEPLKVDKMDTIADAVMVNKHTNIQANDAIALTAQAQKYANKEKADNPNLATPTVSVTGHSLGGTLAQITAHNKGLRGEAFNPYGATALDRKIPEGQGNFTNHVLAGDAVSSGARHYGKTLVYASEKEVSLIEQHNSVRYLRGSTTSAAAQMADSHSITNFTGHDGRSNILADPQAGLRATQHWSSIQNYRQDVSESRQSIGGVLKHVDIEKLLSESPPPPATPDRGGEYGFGADASQPSRNKANDDHDILSKPLSVHASSKEMIDYAFAAMMSSDDNLAYKAFDQVANTDVFKQGVQHSESVVLAFESQQQQLQAQNQTQEVNSPSISMRM